MNKLFNAMRSSVQSFAKDEEGAQVIEYALIVAVVSIALVVLLRGLTENPNGFAAFIDRVTACLSPGGTCE